MRSALAVLLFAAGLAAAAAVAGRTRGRIEPASPGSLSERLAALRLSRELPERGEPEPRLSLQGGRALLSSRSPSGASLLTCPTVAQLASALLPGADRAPPGCLEQALDEPADVVVYELGASVPPLCPGQYATAAQEQLHDALYLPALPPEDVPAGALARGSLTQCAEGGANCALVRAASVALYCGVLRTCAEGACAGGRDLRPDEVATSLAYAQLLSRAPARADCGPVAPATRLSLLLSEAVTATTAGAFADAQPWDAPGLASPGSAGTAAAVRAFFATNPRGVCFLVKGVDLSRPREAQLLAEGLAFPVFAAADPRAPNRATPLLRPLLRAASSEATLAALLPACDAGSERACSLQRARTSASLRAALAGLEPPLPVAEARDLALHVAGSGPYLLEEEDRLHLLLRSGRPRAAEGRPPLLVRYEPLAQGALGEQQRRCRERHAVCLFRGAASRDLPEAAPSEDPHASLLALFARAGADARCVRRLFNALASRPRVDALVRSVAEAGAPPCDPRSLLPGTSLLCQAPAAAEPFGAAAQTCPPLRLAYLEGEPWADLAAQVATLAAGAGIAVTASPVGAADLRASAADWDIVLTAEGDALDRRSPSLAKLLSGPGAAASSARAGRALLAAYEESLRFPPASWRDPSAEAPPPRAESLRRLEEETALRGPAPIFALAFTGPALAVLPAAHAAAAGGPWYLARLLDENAQSAAPPSHPRAEEGR